MAESSDHAHKQLLEQVHSGCAGIRGGPMHAVENQAVLQQDP
jgi:hypothetical protein